LFLRLATEKNDRVAIAQIQLFDQRGDLLLVLRRRRGASGQVLLDLRHGSGERLG